MANRIPAVASIVLVDALRMSSTLPIIAGSSSDAGKWFDLVSMHNLNLSQVHAECVLSQSWDGTFAFNVAAPPTWTARGNATVPKLTNQHQDLNCRVFGFTPTGGGLVRFTAVTSGNTSTVTLPTAPSAWTAGATTLDMSGSFGANDYETILIETSIDVNIKDIALEYFGVNPGGAYPGADDVMPLGLNVDGTYPLDTNGATTDSPMTSEHGQTLASGITTCAARFRSYIALFAIDAAGFATPNPGVPWRTVEPMHDELQTVYWRLQGVQDAVSARTHVIQHGPSSIGEAHSVWTAGDEALGFTQVEIVAGGGGTVWMEGSVVVRSAAIVQGPGAYLGFATLGIYPDVGLLSFSMWST